MSQIKLTKTQMQLLRLLDKGQALVDGQINGKSFSFDTISTLQRRKLIEEEFSRRGDYGAQEYFNSLRHYTITARGTAVLAKGGLVSKSLSPRQKEILLDCTEGLDIILETRDEWRRHYQGEKAVDSLTISILFKQGYLKKIDPDRDMRVLGSGYTITEKGMVAVAPSAS